MSKILIGSPIRQKATILKEFLKGLVRVEKGNNDITYFFVDDNDEEQSSLLLQSFFDGNSTVIVKKSDEILLGMADNKYICDDSTHHWNSENIERITVIKDYIIDYCIDNEFDYLFLIDSDIVLDCRALLHLLKRDVGVVSNVFYTQWMPNGPLVPQCFWIPDVYSQFESFNKALSYSEATQIKTDLFTRIRVPGIYRVDGLGACTLIKSEVLKKGVCFKAIRNLALPGEDRHFCIRAGVMDVDLYIDSVYPAYHIFREEYISRVNEFVNNGFSFDMCKTSRENTIKVSKSKSNKFVNKVPIDLFYKVRRYLNNKRIEKKESKKNSDYFTNRNLNLSNDRIVLQMTVYNECGKYLERSLSSVRNLIDYYVIIDDASTDGTVELVESLLNGLPYTIVKNNKSMFHEEYKLRQKLWDEAIKHNPGWVMSLDADEVLQENGDIYIRELIKNDEIDGLSFKYYDMWNELEYREDEYWHSHKGFRPYLMRYIPGCNYSFKQTNQHCGSFPINYYQRKYANVNVKIKHYGWADEASRQQKYKRYLKLDPNGEYGNMKQYLSILDSYPHLKPFDELPDGV